MLSKFRFLTYMWVLCTGGELFNSISLSLEFFKCFIRLEIIQNVSLFIRRREILSEVFSSSRTSLIMPYEL